LVFGEGGAFAEGAGGDVGELLFGVDEFGDVFVDGAGAGQDPREDSVGVVGAAVGAADCLAECRGLVVHLVENDVPGGCEGVAGGR